MISFWNTSNECKSFIFCKNFQKFNCQWIEISNALESLIEQFDFFSTNSSILCKKIEWLWMFIESLNVYHVFIDCIQWFLLWSCWEKNTCISTFNGILVYWCLIIRSTIYYVDISYGEWLKKLRAYSLRFLWFTSSRKISSFFNNWDWFWSWFWSCFRFRSWFLKRFFFNSTFFISGFIVSSLLLFLLSEASLLSNWNIELTFKELYLLIVQQ